MPGLSKGVGSVWVKVVVAVGSRNFPIDYLYTATSVVPDNLPSVISNYDWMVDSVPRSYSLGSFIFVDLGIIDLYCQLDTVFIITMATELDLTEAN